MYGYGITSLGRTTTLLIETKVLSIWNLLPLSDPFDTFSGRFVQQSLFLLNGLITSLRYNGWSKNMHLIMLCQYTHPRWPIKSIRTSGANSMTVPFGSI